MFKNIEVYTPRRLLLAFAPKIKTIDDSYNNSIIKAHISKPTIAYTKSRGDEHQDVSSNSQKFILMP